MGLETLHKHGWTCFAQDAKIAKWVAHVQPHAADIALNPAHIAAWLRYGGTWFAGVNILPNDLCGRLGTGPALAGKAVDFLTELHGPLALDQAQISVI